MLLKSMKRLVSTLALALPMAIISNSAQASDSGFRVGAFLQGTFIDQEIKERSFTAPANNAPWVYASGNTSIDSLGGGIAAGYDLAIHDSYFVGVEADFSLIEDHSSYAGGTYHADYLFTLRGRAGLEVADGLSVYGTAGIGWLNVGYRGDEGGNDGGVVVVATAGTTAVDKVLFGWVIGAGGEYELGDFEIGSIELGDVSLFAEYLYADFEDYNFNKGTERYDVETEMHIIRVGVKIKLGNDD